MNPVQLMWDISEMSQIQAFNYSRYCVTGSQLREIIEFYNEKLPAFGELDERLAKLHEKLRTNIEVMSSRLR